MRIVDTHSHLYVKEFQEDINEVVIRAKKEGIANVLLPNIDMESIPDLKNLKSLYPNFFLTMMGLHPTSVKEDWRKQLEFIYNELTSDNYIAVGEIGIDLYWDDAFKEEQISAFEEQLEWSRDMKLPVSIHFRNATEEVITSIKRVGGNLRGVFHSFGGGRDELNAILEIDNFLIGVNGVVTFKNSGLSETLKYCPKERLVLETDAPYLAPVPHRGKRNESSYLRHISRKLSEIWEMDELEVAAITTKNAENLFGFTSI